MRTFSTVLRWLLRKEFILSSDLMWKSSGMATFISYESESG